MTQPVQVDPMAVLEITREQLSNALAEAAMWKAAHKELEIRSTEVIGRLQTALASAQGTAPPEVPSDAADTS